MKCRYLREGNSRLSSKLTNWTLGIGLGLAMALAAELLIGFSNWFSRVLFGRNVGTVGRVVLLLCVLISLVAIGSFLLGPHIHRLIQQRNRTF
jgi:hypothetical protein